MPLTFIVRTGKHIKPSNYLTTNKSLLNFSIFAKKGWGGRLKKLLPLKHCKGKFWLVKPSCLNQGRGIKLYNSVKSVCKFINKKKQNQNWIVQKYIEKPLLYKGRKFDVRVWVVVTAKFEIMMYTQGYIRTSSNEYTLKSYDNFIHLTNNCL